MAKRLMFALLAGAIVIGGIAYLIYLGCEMSEWRTGLIEGGRCEGRAEVSREHRRTT